MPTFRILDQTPAYLGYNGRPAALGELRFYDSGTTTPKDVYGDPDMVVNNGPVVQLDSSGRAQVDIWGDGNYRVRLYLEDGTLVAEADDVSIPGGVSQTLTVPNEGEFVSGDGTSFQNVTILQIPDPTGQDGKMLVADGEGVIWQPIPEAPEPPAPDIVITGTSSAGSFTAGTSDSTTKYRRMWGQASAPANAGGKTTQVNITFTPPFVANPVVHCTIIGTAITQNGAYLGDVSVSGISAAGATLNVNTNHGEANSDGNIPSAVALNWTAEGTAIVT